MERPFDARQLLRLLGYMRPYRSTVVKALLAIMAGAAAGLSIPILTRNAIDRSIANPDLSLLSRYALLMLGACIVSFFAGACALTVQTGLDSRHCAICAMICSRISSLCHLTF